MIPGCVCVGGGGGSSWPFSWEKEFPIRVYHNVKHNVDPLSGSHTTLEGHDFKDNLHLAYVRKFSSKSQLFWPIGSYKKYFKMIPPYFCLFLIIPLHRGNDHSFDQGWFVPSLIEIGIIVVLEKKMWKVDNDDRQIQILIRKAHFSLRLRWAIIGKYK